MGIGIDNADAQRLLAGTHAAPHDLLGCHPLVLQGRAGVVVRAMHPDATAASVRIAGTTAAMQPLAQAGLFAAFFEGLACPQQPELTFTFPDGADWRVVDPYSLWPTLGDQDLHLFCEGRHFEVWKVLGARARFHDGQHGTAFAVWAPSAAGVSVVCDHNRWDGRVWPMRAMGSSGVYELFVPGVGPGARYQFDVRCADGLVLRKADPYAEQADHPPGRASVVTAQSDYAWGDAVHMAVRPRQDRARQPMNVYEVHPGSYRRHPDGRVLNYRELAEELVPHLLHFGFTHLELLPICEHPFEGSWGYQVTGFYAPSSRFGSPDDFRYLVDRCHQAGIEVIVDWVPAHFPKDDFALARFDGTALYEHEDPRKGEHPDWGTLIFNYGRREVQSFLIGSALYMLQELHVDGLRVDAVASMLYLDYSREEGQWIPNAHGGRENLEAVDFLRHLNSVIAQRAPGCYTIAEESTSWAGVTAPTSEGGLGFTFKWNMGWMHDTLQYFSRDTVHRRYHQDDLTFASVYERSEHFLMPLSHDEVVHGKHSLLHKMPGDRWQQFANLRALLTYQYTRPGKKLVFMGTEFAQEHEWDHRTGLPWPSADDAERQAFMRFFAALGHMYQRQPALYAADVDDGGFRFIDTGDHGQSVLSYLRRHAEQQLVVVLNLTPVPRPGYRIGAPGEGTLTTLFDSDAAEFGGSDWQASRAAETEPVAMHGFANSVALDLPPLGVLVLAYQQGETVSRARRQGIATDYYTIDGVRHVTAPATRDALLDALGDEHPVGPAAEGSFSSGGRPVTAYPVQEVLDGRPALGIWTQLYSLHSERSWGIGDLGDLRTLLRWAGKQGLDFVGLNPLHAMSPVAQPAIPYHPSTRLFSSPLYIDVVAVPEYRALCETGPLVPDFAARKQALRGACEEKVHSALDNVNYPAVLQLKLDVLRGCHAQLDKLPQGDPRRLRFARFTADGGLALRRFGIYCSIQAELQRTGQPAHGWQDFPEPLRDVDSPAVEDFGERHADEVAFHCYLQWVLDAQLRGCADLCKQLGMRVGLYLDLAVGSAHDGFDAWAFPQHYVRGASLGAPPDALAPQGQDWGLVPMHPGRFAGERAAHFRTQLRASMRHAGALRIDHAMGLSRQFWIPRRPGATGTYVAFPAELLFTVVAEESRAARCIVVAEDLGTVPDGFREALAARDILRYEVLHFARDGAGAFLDPGALQRDALLCLSTHDLPTFSAYWRGADLLRRREMGLCDESDLLVEVQRRVADRTALLDWLRRAGHPLAAGADTPAGQALAAIHRALCSAPSRMLCLSLDDLCGEPQGVNIPGTTAEHGFVSFARPMRRTLESIVDDGALAANLGALLAARRPGPPSRG